MMRVLIKATLAYFAIQLTATSAFGQTKHNFLTCSENGTSIIYTNGLMTIEESAEKHLNAIMHLNTPAELDADEDVEYILSYNSSEKFALDLYEAAIQKLKASIQEQLNIYEYYTSLEAGILLPSVEIQKWLLNYVQNNIQYPTQTVLDVSALVDDYQTSLDDSKKVISVSHSQGGLFVNQAYRELFSKREPSDKELFIALEIATPTTEVAGNGLWRTSPNDLVIRAVRASSGALGANMPLLGPSELLVPLENFVEKDFLYHGLLETYLGVYSLNQNIANAMHEAALMLGSNCAGCEDPNTGDEQIGEYHVNPDGEYGGFVASTATVDPTSSIAETSMVCDQAVVYDYSTIWGHSIIRGNAKVAHYVSIGDSTIGGNSVIYDDVPVVSATIEGNSILVRGNSNSSSNWNAFLGTRLNTDKIGMGPVITGRASLYMTTLLDRVFVNGDPNGSGVTAISSRFIAEKPTDVLILSENAFLFRTFGSGNVHFGGNSVLTHSLLGSGTYTTSGNVHVSDVDAYQSILDLSGSFVSSSYFVEVGPMTAADISNRTCASWVATTNHCEARTSQNSGAYAQDLLFLPSDGPTTIPLTPVLTPVALPTDGNSNP